MIRNPQIALLALLLLLPAAAASQPRDVAQPSAVSADLDYRRGMTLAKLQRWDEAARAFQAGALKSPSDKRFPLELAGIAFHRKRYDEATARLRTALRLDPSDSYANDFLGTVYFLQGNLPAALKYWNRIAKPVLANVTTDPQPRTAPALLDRAFAFSPASVLQAADFQLTQQRLDLLQVFPRYRLELLPREDGRFDLLFRASERNGWGNSKLQALLTLFRNLPFQTVNPEFFNLNRGAANLVSLVRWDSKKQRVFSSFAAPLRGDPQWRYGLHFDWRRERWNLPSGITNAGAPLTVHKTEAGADVQSIPSARWSWRTGLSVSQRSFAASGFAPAFAQFLQNGTELKYTAQLDAKLIDIPEKRFTTTAFAAVESGRLWGARDASFTKTTAAVKAAWLPASQGDDYRTSAQLRWGKAIGQAPFDELFMLGMERDTDLAMHAHLGAHDGMKGSAPLGRHYFLLNWELDKDLHRGALFHLSIGPLLDTGRFLDDSPVLGPREWMCDLGVQAKLRVFGGVGLVFSYARDLRRGRNATYATGLP